MPESPEKPGVVLSVRATDASPALIADAYTISPCGGCGEPTLVSKSSADAAGTRPLTLRCNRCIPPEEWANAAHAVGLLPGAAQEAEQLQPGLGQFGEEMVEAFNAERRRRQN